MRDELLGYYERELIFLRRLGAQFAEKYPKVAGRLQLEPDKCEDPHVERMIEAFAFLAGRIHLKLDDELPEITESFLNVLYPHYLSPVPSMSIAQFALDPNQGKLTSAYQIDKGRLLYSRPVQGTQCKFRTSYPVTLWPIEIESATFDSKDPVGNRGTWENAEIRIKLRCLNDARLDQLRIGQDEKSPRIDKLRFYLSGEPQLVYPLYEAIFNNAVSVEAWERPHPAGMEKRITLPASSLRSVGFEEDEGMLKYTAQSFAGYRLLTEYFAFPDKFLFFDVTGLDKAGEAGFGEKFEIVIRLRDVPPPRATVDASTFQLGCTPIINLFDKVSEPIDLTREQNEYRVIPDLYQQVATEIYSINSVTGAGAYAEEVKTFKPFYSYGHSSAENQNGSFWYATRRPSQLKEDAGTDVFISLVDLNFDPRVPGEEIITCNITCTNRDLPGKLPFGSKNGDYEIENAGPLDKVRCLRKPTETFRPPMRRSVQWRLISHLSLNHLSLVDERNSGSPDALREILTLYDYLGGEVTRRQIRGLLKVNGEKIVRRVGARPGTGFVRGIETTVEFDEEQFTGSGLFLFASVLERFLALYTSINSFNQLTIKSKQREGLIKQWTPRAGDRILL